MVEPIAFAFERFDHRHRAGAGHDAHHRQRSYGGLNDDRQRSYGGASAAELDCLRAMLDDPALGHLRTYLNEMAIQRQRAYGLYDPNYDRQRSYGGMNDDRQR